MRRRVLRIFPGFPFKSLSTFALCIGGMLPPPAVALAQGAIAGQVTDQSGSVMPGVTVEAASPALIEGARSRSPTGRVDIRYRTSGQARTR